MPLERILITLLLICFAVWLVGVFVGWFQMAASTHNPLFLILAIILVFLILRELNVFGRGRLFCGGTSVRDTEHACALQKTFESFVPS